MGLQAVIKRAAIAAPAFALAFGIATHADAQSIQPGCYPAATVKAALAQDNQQPIAIGNRSTDNHPVNMFTSNSKGTLGYNVEGDKSFGTPSTKLCVAAIYKDVQVNDVNSPVIPTSVRKGANSAVETDLNAAYAKGSRVVFTAETFTKLPNGTEKPGQQLVVVAMPEKLGAALAVDNTGRVTPVFPLRDFAKTNFADSLLAAAPVTPTTGTMLAATSIPAAPGLQK